MKSKNLTYMLLSVAVFAIGASVVAYAYFGKHQIDLPSLPLQTDIPVRAVADATQTPGTPKPSILTSAKTPAKPDTKPATQTETVTPVKPTTPVQQTPAVAPIVVTPPPAPISLPYNVSNFSSHSAWTAIIGNVGVKFLDYPYRKNLLTISAGPKTTDGFVELAGSEGWGDYTFSMNTNFISGPAFSLIARYVDSKNYTSCIFSQGGVTRVNSVVNGKSTIITENKDQLPTIPYVEDIDYSVKVQGSKIQCIVNGSTVRADVSAMSPTGGIGIEVYNQAPGSSALNVQKVSVNE